MLFKRPYTVIYPVPSIKDGIGFFERLFGVPPSYKSPSWANFNLGNIRLGLREDLERPCLVFYIESVKRARDELRKLGFEVGEEKELMPYGWEFEVKTPWGEKLLIFQPMNRKVLESSFFLKLP